MLRSVGSVLLDQSTRSTGTLKRWLVGTDAFDLAETDSKQALYQVLILDSLCKSAEEAGIACGKPAWHWQPSSFGWCRE